MEANRFCQVSPSSSDDQTPPEVAAYARPPAAASPLTSSEISPGALCTHPAPSLVERKSLSPSVPASIVPDGRVKTEITASFRGPLSDHEPPRSSERKTPSEPLEAKSPPALLMRRSSAGRSTGPTYVQTPLAAS